MTAARLILPTTYRRSHQGNDLTHLRNRDVCFMTLLLNGVNTLLTTTLPPQIKSSIGTYSQCPRHRWQTKSAKVGIVSPCLPLGTLPHGTKGKRETDRTHHRPPHPGSTRSAGRRRRQPRTHHQLARARHPHQLAQSPRAAAEEITRLPASSGSVTTGDRESCYPRLLSLCLLDRTLLHTSDHASANAATLPADRA